MANISLINMDAFFEETRKRLDEAQGLRYALVAMDIDYFKLYNELYGRDAGDACLENMGEHLKDFVDNVHGIAAYVGRDDFAALIPWAQEHYDDVEKYMSKMVGQGFKEGFHPSIGVYVIEDPAESVYTMYDKALLAVSRIKGNYAEHVRLYDNKMLERLRDSHTIMVESQQAIKNDEFTFYLQPQCNMHNGRIVGAEALVRWPHKVKGFISPGSFIPVLEKNGYVVALDRTVWEGVCKWQRSLIDRGINPLPVSVNISRIDFYFMDVAEFFCQLIDKYDIPADLIEVEITESTIAEESESMLRAIETFHKAGFKILMDDFGTGFSSLNMLRSVNIDILKTDMRFLSSKDESESRGISIMESVFNLARQIGTPVIAEGAETRKQIDDLIDMGCTYVQGYYYYEPMPIEEYEELLTNDALLDRRGVYFRKIEQFHIREFLDENLYSDTMLNNILGAIAIYELQEDGRIRILRMNEHYYQVTGARVTDDAEYREHLMHYVSPQDEEALIEIFQQADANPLGGGSGVISYHVQESETELFIQVFLLNSRNGNKVYYASLKRADSPLTSFGRFV